MLLATPSSIGAMSSQIKSAGSKPLPGEVRMSALASPTCATRRGYCGLQFHATPVAAQAVAVTANGPCGNSRRQLSRRASRPFSSREAR